MKPALTPILVPEAFDEPDPKTPLMLVGQGVPLGEAAPRLLRCCRDGKNDYVVPLYLGTPDPGPTVQIEALQVLHRHLGVGFRQATSEDFDVSGVGPRRRKALRYSLDFLPFAYGVAPPQEGTRTRQAFLHGIIQIVDHALNGHQVLASYECDIQQGTIFTNRELLDPTGAPRFALEVKALAKACAEAFEAHLFGSQPSRVGM